MSAERVVCVVGATATGKSALAVELAERIDGEIVNADALQAYRGLDIGTAKPTAEERRRAPHHLLDILDPRETYSAGEFARRADACIDGIRDRGRVAIVVGGSGLYQRALVNGLAALPQVPAEVRQQLRRELREQGLASLRAELGRVDPITFARLTPGDTQRTLRALEIWRSSGSPLSRWVSLERPRTWRYPVVRLGLTLPRGLLYSRIQSRVSDMVRRGWLEEVKGLLARGIPAAAPAFQAIGYRQIVRHLSQEGQLDRTVSEIVLATRRYAKRQETWFRGEEGVSWLDARDRRGALETALRAVSRE